ncbi:hypothetical protein N9M50_07065 [Alphaproteobacteria bacterium]|jgi:hypothetical protein|nr:hypothetical protein [Alphaproteobacteria bacterium]
MSEIAENLVAFYSSSTGLPFIILLATIALTAAAFITLFRQHMLLKRVIANMAWQNEQINKRLQALHGVVLDRPEDVQSSEDIVPLIVRAIEPKMDSLQKQVESIKVDLTRLSDNVSEQEQISKAIEMARRGARRTELVDATGISAEQADAIVKFHGPSQV